MKTTAAVIFLGASVLFRAAVDVMIPEIQQHQLAYLQEGPQ